MAAILAEVHIPDKNGLPADDMINTFAFIDTNVLGLPIDLAGNVHSHLVDFYNSPAAGVGTFALCNYMGPSLDTVADRAKIVYYKLADAGSVTPVTPLGGPLLTSTWTFTGPPGGAVALPRECAAVLSLHGVMTGLAEDTPGGAPGPVGDTHPAARHRGRIYIGPLTTGAMAAATAGPTLASVILTSATNAGATLLSALAALGTGSNKWCIWSRTNHNMVPVTGGWMDDALDTQRRRGVKATTRTLF